MGYFKNLLIEYDEEIVNNEIFDIDEIEICDDWDQYKKEEQLSEKNKT